MKKLLFCLMALLCVMGASAQNRSISTNISKEYQLPVNVSIDNQAFTLTPQKATIQEVDAKHVKVIVFHNRGKADVTLPVSYDFTLKAIKALWDMAYKWNFLSEKEYNLGCQEWNKQKINK